jgi:hypothetical protein
MNEIQVKSFLENIYNVIGIIKNLVVFKHAIIINCVSDVGEEIDHRYMIGKIGENQFLVTGGVSSTQYVHMMWDFEAPEGIRITIYNKNEDKYLELINTTVDGLKTSTLLHNRTNIYQIVRAIVIRLKSESKDKRDSVEKFSMPRFVAAYAKDILEDQTFLDIFKIEASNTLKRSFHYFKERFSKDRMISKVEYSDILHEESING